MLQNHKLLNISVSSEGLGREIRSNPTSQIFVFLSIQIDHVMLTKELLPEWMADELESIRPYISEDLVASFRASDKNHELSDYVIGGNSKRRGFSIFSLDIPEFGWVSDERDYIAQKWRDEGGTREAGFLPQV